MTTPTNDRQTSERERLHGVLSQIAEIERLTAEIAALRTELARLRLTHTETAANLAAADEQVHASDEIIAALRAENEALRTVTMDDACAAAAAYANAVVAMHAADDPREVCADPEAMLPAIQSFIRSKESSRG